MLTVGNFPGRVFNTCLRCSLERNISQCLSHGLNCTIRCRQLLNGDARSRFLIAAKVEKPWSVCRAYCQCGGLHHEGVCDAAGRDIKEPPRVTTEVRSDFFVKLRKTTCRRIGCFGSLCAENTQSAMTLHPNVGFNGGSQSDCWVLDSPIA